MHVGEIIHKLRKERKMTLLELSKRSGVALATLSRMENGKMTGTLESHMSISKALEIELPDLYRDLVASGRKVEVSTKGSRADVFVHDKKTSVELLVTDALSKKMMPSTIRLARGGSMSARETKPGIEKFLFVLDGKIEVRIGEEMYGLSKGDTLYFESSAPHAFRNVAGTESRILCVTCPPVP